MLGPDRVGEEAVSLVALLARRAAEQPHRLAYAFLAKGEVEAARLTYAGLDRAARSIASQLIAHGAADERAILLYPSGLDFVAAFFGALGARTTAVPVATVDTRLAVGALPRIRAIAADCGARFVLTTSALLQIRPMLVAQAPELGALTWIATDAAAASAAAANDAAFGAPGIDAETVALLQYTSGSTSSPRGVVVSHGNILHNCGLMKHAFGQGPESRLVTWLPVYHDMGLIGCLLEPLYSGYPDYIMPSLDFVKHPLRWLGAIARYRATVSGAPNFAYDLCARKISDEQARALDLSSWRVAFCGAEPVHAETMRRFVEKFAPAGFRPESFFPCYGLAEATLMVAAGPKAGPPAVEVFDHESLARHEVRPPSANRRSRTLVSCGPPAAEQEVLIVDPDDRSVLPADRVGEIWVKGPSVAQGYWGRPEKTRETFAATTADGRGPFLRTGDLGFCTAGQLFVCGRIKDIIVVGGRNHYPQDIERTVHASLPELRVGGVAAFSIEHGEEERLVLVLELGATSLLPARREEIVAGLRDVLFREHHLGVHDVVFSGRGTIPRTSSGKLQRLRCREDYLSGLAPTGS